ncbi:unnamed protein product [Rotaria socialis]
MEHSCAQLMDMPDEILLFILTKLTNIEVLYSLIGVNIELDKIASDPVFTNHLTLMKCSSNGDIYPLAKSILDRFCLQILPKIQHQINWLNLELLSMKRILLAGYYPNLRGFGLFIVEPETVAHLFVEEDHFGHTVKNRISTLIITLSDKEKKIFSRSRMKAICTRVFTIFTNLICLKFYPYSDIYINFVERLTFNQPREYVTFSSSTLTQLYINVETFNDCLYLLDGRFKQLHRFYVNALISTPPLSTIPNTAELINLKCFSLTCDIGIGFYEESLVSLLHRMSNLEELSLYTSICRFSHGKTFIDGNNLKHDIIYHMSKLKKFMFSIHSDILIDQSISLPSNEDIQRTFEDLKDYHIISYVDYFPKENIGQCHIYSYPSRMIYYHNLTNSFPGGLFKFVHRVLIYDERPFEYEFFIRIAKAFPFLKMLTIENRSPQLNEDNQNLPIIEYPHLIHLDLASAHDNYIEQLLVNTKTCLSNYIHLVISYRSLQRVTHNFTRDTMRVNCAKVKYLYVCDKSDVPEQFHVYFPYVENF